MTPPAAAPGAAARSGRADRRLTVGWHRSGRPASLAEHHDRYGPLPGRGRSLTDAVAAAGLTGRGGAGFPAAAKMRAVASRPGPAVVVANGMESEPASEKDQALLARAPHLVLDGAVAAAAAVGADTVYICLNRERTAQVSLIDRAIGERRHAGPDGVRLLVGELPGRYVASEETALVRWLNGGTAKPAAKPPRPFERGVGRRPTLVGNVETLAHLALIARFGPAWFRQAGRPDAPGTMLVTVGGAAASPGVYEIEAGTPVGDVLAQSGAADTDAVLLGGYFGTWHDAADVASLPLTAAGLARVGGTPGAGVVFALAAGRCGLAETARILRYLAGESARQCGPCRFGLPAIAGDFAQLAAGKPQGNVLTRLERRLRVVPGRGACRHPDGAVRMAASALRAFPADAAAHAAGRPCAGARLGWATGTAVPLPPPAEAEWR